MHDIPADGGILSYDQYAGTVLVRLVVTRDLRVWVLHSRAATPEGDRRRCHGKPASTYRTTVRWAEAAHAIGLDGLVWMPAEMQPQTNRAKAYVFFGDTCAQKMGAFAQDPTHARMFASPADQLWLIDLCAPLHVDVLMQPS